MTKRTPSLIQKKEGEAALFMEEVLKSLKPGAAVLDAGCGSGSFVHSEYPGLRVVSLDVAFPVPDPQGREPKNFVLGSAERMPFGESSFDFLVLNYVLEHVSDAAATIAECSRVLRPGAFLYAALPRASSFDDRFYRFAGYFAKYVLLKLKKRLEHQQRFDFVSLNRDLYRNGFRLLCFCECPSGYTWMNDARVKKLQRPFLKTLTFVKRRLGIDLFKESNYLTLFEYVGLTGVRPVTHICAECGMPLVAEGTPVETPWSCPHCGSENVHS